MKATERDLEAVRQKAAKSLRVDDRPLPDDKLDRLLRRRLAAVRERDGELTEDRLGAERAAFHFPHPKKLGRLLESDPALAMNWATFAQLRADGYGNDRLAWRYQLIAFAAARKTVGHKAHPVPTSLFMRWESETFQGGTAQTARARESTGRTPVRRRGSRRGTAPTRGSPDDPDDDGDSGPSSARAEPLRAARGFSWPAPRHLGRDILPGVLADLAPDAPAELQRHLARMRRRAA